MEIETLSEACTGCFACYSICPRKAITMKEDPEGFYYPNIDPAKCIRCNLCTKVCPSLHVTNTEASYKSFCGYSHDSTLRKSSSSGGFFSALADLIIASKGNVYGASFKYGDELSSLSPLSPLSLLRLEHHSTDEVNIESLRKSKYVQSYVGDSFSKVKADLETGRQVLFVGTPCQVAGLISFLGKDYDNLLTCDFVCHGVPSMKLLRSHLKYIGFEKLEEVKKIDFRPKIISWVDYLVVESDKKKYAHYYIFDPYYNAFNKSCISLRKSCYNCLYCNGKNKKSDITLADFWGVVKSGISIDQKDGLSLILANTSKGCEYIDRLKNSNFVLKSIPERYAQYVYERIRSKKAHYDIEARNRFYGDYVSKGYKFAVNNNGLKQSIIGMYIFEIKRIVKKLLGR